MGTASAPPRRSAACWVAGVFATIGCAGGAQSPTALRVVVPLEPRPAGDPALPGAASLDDVRAAMASVRAAFEEGDVARASSLLDSIPIGAVPGDQRDAYTRLRIDVRRAQIRERYLAASAAAESASVMLGEPVRIDLELCNRAEAPVSVSASRAAGSAASSAADRSIVNVEVGYFEFDRTGARYEATWHRRLPLRRDVVLAPGEKTNLRFSLETDEPRLRPERLVLRRFLVRATLWPISIAIGDSQFLTPLPFPPVSVEILPPGAEAVQADPETALSRALEVRGRADVANHVFFAALFLLREDPTKGAFLLHDALAAGDPDTRAAAVSALRISTGDFEHDDPEAWRNWCASRLAEPGR